LLIQYFEEEIRASALVYRVYGNGPIFGIIVPGNDFCRAFSVFLQQNGLDVRPILSPTVPIGAERLRVIIHSYNTKAQIDFLISLLVDYK
jgi:8-amino-7-oxononanoate synthase